MKTELEQKITEYLCVGGMWNPELMEHDKVRDMIMECRDTLAIQRERIESLDQGQNRIAAIANDMERQRDAARDAAREDAERLATALRLAQYGETDECVVCGHMIRCATTCEIGTALAAHEALKTKS